MPTGDEEPPRDDFAALAAQDAAWTAAANAEGFDPGREAAALRSLFEGESSALVDRACESMGKAAQLLTAKGVWASLRQQDEAQISGAVFNVVDSLEAPHLKPSNIESRLRDVPASCMSLLSLASKLYAHDAPVGPAKAGGETG